MATVYPAMKGQFGSTEYFMITMKANDVTKQLIIPKDMPNWDDLKLEERYQREINYNRVKKQIAPYLAHDPDRFLGALIVEAYNPENMKFKPADDLFKKKVIELYQTAAKSFGFLILSGGEMLVPLDGQHRLKAIEFAMDGKDEKEKPVNGITPNTDLANDDVLLMIIKHDGTSKGRKIFNKVNRYAKATTTAENLITADDDIIAIISRDIANNTIGGRLVNYRSNTLPESSSQFTTLSTIYQATQSVLEEKFGKINRQALPTPREKKLYEDSAHEYWRELSNHVTLYYKALHDKEESGDDHRRQIRKDFLIGKPVVQLVLMNAVVKLMHSSKSDGSKFSWEDIHSRINKVDWKSSNELWQHILKNGTKIISGKQAVNFASSFIAYYLGEKLSEKEIANLRARYASHFPESVREGTNLPDRLFK